MTTEDTINGAQLLLDRIEFELEKKRISPSRRLDLEFQRYQLKHLVILREDVRKLKQHDLIQRMQENPKLSFVIIFLALVLNGMINWSGIRKPILQAFVYQVFGVLLPLDSIP